MSCIILNFISNKKHLFYENYDYVFVDVNSLTVTPYLSIEKYQSTDRFNISPFVETIKFYANMKKVLPKTKFIFVFDGGISSKIKKIYPKYKMNRSSKRTKGVFDGIKSKSYDYNCMLITQALRYFGEIVIPSNVISNESDFMIGYILKNIKKVNDKLKMLVISHDMDYLMAFDENVHVIYKYTAPQMVKNYLIKSFDCICDILDYPYLRNVEELMFYKALLGDKSDNIEKPFGIRTKVPVENYFADCCMEDISITYESIIKHFSKKFKKESIIKKFESEFRRNLFITNIFNEDVISDVDRIKLNDIINNILYPENTKVEINLVKEFIMQYGLYFDEDDIDKLFKFLKG